MQMRRKALNKTHGYAPVCPFLLQNESLDDRPGIRRVLPVRPHVVMVETVAYVSAHRPPPSVFVFTPFFSFLLTTCQTNTPQELETAIVRVLRQLELGLDASGLWDLRD